MDVIIQLGIVIGIIILFLYLLSKVINLIVKTTILITGIFLIISVLFLFNVYNEIQKNELNNFGLIIANKTKVILALDINNGNIKRTSIENIDDRLKEKFKNKTIIIVQKNLIDKMNYNFNRDFKLKKYGKIKETIMNKIKEKSFIQISLLALKKDIMIKKNTKLLEICRIRMFNISKSLNLKVLKNVVKL